MIEKVPRLLLPLSSSGASHGIVNTESEKKKRDVNSLYDNLYSPRTEITEIMSSRQSDVDVHSPARTFRETQDLSVSDTGHIPRTSSIVEFIHRTGSIDEYQHGFLDSPVGSPRSTVNTPRNVMSRTSRAHNCPHLAAPSPMIFPSTSHSSLIYGGGSSGMGAGPGAIDADLLEASLQKASLSLLQASMDELDVDDGSIPAWDQWNDTDNTKDFHESYSSSPRLSFEEHPSDSGSDEANTLYSSRHI